MIPRFRAGDWVHNKSTDEEAKVICVRPAKDTPVYSVAVEAEGKPGSGARHEDWPESVLESSVQHWR